MEARSARGATSGRGRVLDAAYDLFSRAGVNGVGIDAVIAEAGVAKATLYRNFESKDDLALAFLELREERWTNDWMRVEAVSRASTPEGQLLAIFDIFGEWFARDDYEGCAFVNVLLNLPERDDPVRQACVRHLENIRGFVHELADEAGIEDPDAFSRQWHILMKGALVAAAEGDVDAAARARQIGELLLDRCESA